VSAPRIGRVTHRRRICLVYDDVPAVSLLLGVGGCVQGEGGCVDVVRPSYVLAGAVGWEPCRRNVRNAQ
jgi:hypothetical protein